MKAYFGHVFFPAAALHQNLMDVSCPECGSPDLEVISGNELIIKEVEYEEG